MSMLQKRRLDQWHQAHGSFTAMLQSAAGVIVCTRTLKGNSFVPTRMARVPRAGARCLSNVFRTTTVKLHAPYHSALNPGCR